MNFKITSKILVLCVSLVLLTSLLLGGFNVVQYRSVLIDTMIKEREKEVLLISSSINSNISELRNDTLFLSLSPPVSGLVRASSRRGVDPVDNSTKSQWVARLTTIFKEMMTAKKDYMQLRYIGVQNGGREMVRVDRRNGEIVEISGDNLQVKSQEPYFKETIKLKEGEIYLSDFSANREHGEIVYPVEMVLRAAVPVFDQEGKIFGLIVINIEYNRIFSALKSIIMGNDEYFVANEQGNILLHTDPKFTLNTVPFKLKSIHDILPGLKEKKSKDDSYLESSYYEDSNEEIYVVRKLFYNPIDEGRQLWVFVKIDENDIQEEVSNKYRRNLYIIVTMIFFSVLFSLFFSRVITKPILELTDFAQTIGKGLKKQRIKVTSNDEIGILSKTLNKMSDELDLKDEALRYKNEALDATTILAETDVKGKITYVNRKFLEISKYQKDELIGQDHRILNSNYHSKDFFKSLWAKIKKGEIWRGEIKNRAKDGTFYWVETTIFPVVKSDGKIEKFIAIRYEITQQKKTLEDLELANQKALKAANAKASFLANMSHEIRTPLNGILGFSNLLVDSDLKGESFEHAKLIKDCSESLLLIINDILDISKIEAGKLSINKTEVDVKEMLAASGRVFKSLLLSKEVELSIEIKKSVPDGILVDPLRIRQVLINLIGNAIKFTDKGYIKVVVDVEERSNSKDLRLIWSVEDTGVGIPKTAMGKLFQAFEQVDDSRTREHGGTGLGLAISSKIVELMGGKIWVESDVGVGAIFFFTTEAKEVSLKKEKSNNENNAETESSSETNLKILVAEDNKINQKLIVKVLEKLGYTEVIIANNGLEAVNFCRQAQFDLILMDVQMPEMDGYKATSTIKEMNRNIIIVGLSANAFTDDKEKGFKSGMNDYLAKPINPQEIATLLRRYESILEKG